MGIPAAKAPAGQPTKSRTRKSARRVCILVLGMHRSGTGALARVLGLLGCDLPQTAMQAHDAGEGQSWRSEAIGQLNDRILASAGSRWDDWLEFNPGWLASPRAEEFREEGLALVREEFGASRQFVLEDHRICRLLPFWLGVLEEAGAQPLIVSPVRNPLEVAASLEERDGIEAGLGHLLWLRHVLDAEYASRGLQRFFTSYDRLSAGWARTASNAETTLGITWPRISDKAAAEIESFLSENNSRYRQTVDAAVDNPALSDWLRGSFEILGRWSASGEDPEDFAALDRIRAAFNTAAPAFSRALSAVEDKVSRLEADLASQADAAEKAEQALVEAGSKLAAAEQVTAAEQEKAARLETELTRERERLGESEQQIRRLKSQLESWTGAARAAEEELTGTQAKLAAAQASAAAEQDRATRLKAELESQTRAAKEAESALAELRHQLAQTESALAQRRHEAEETAGALAVTREELRHTAEARAVAESVSAGLKEHVVLLMADLKERQAAFASAQETGAAESATMARQVKHVLAVLETSRHELASRLSEAERAMKQQADEIETLKALVEEKQGEARQERDNAEQFRQAAAGEIETLKALVEEKQGEALQERDNAEQFRQAAAGEIETLKALVEEKQSEARDEREKAEHLRQAAAGEIARAVAGLLNGRGSPLWRPFRLRRQAALLKRSGLFDAEWYLREYTDVAEAGMNPLRHYIEFGAKEGRAPNPAVSRLNGKA